VVIVVFHHIVREPGFDVRVQERILGQAVDKVDQRQAHALMVFEQVVV
jgi:hypothetical protein